MSRDLIDLSNVLDLEVTIDSVLDLISSDDLIEALDEREEDRTQIIDTLVDDFELVETFIDRADDSMLASLLDGLNAGQINFIKSYLK